MRRPLLLLAYNLLLPVVFVLLFPAWLVKMLRRGGYGSGLRERVGIYRKPAASEKRGGVYFHAVSVGETMIALKLIDAWHRRDPERHFVLAVTTSTGRAVAETEPRPHVRTIYAPLDFRFLVRRCLNRFAPQQIVLIESEIWPNLLDLAKRREIPVRLVNARLSPRSERRYRKAAPWVRQIFGMLDAVAVQEPADAPRWQTLGIPAEAIKVTGSVKFDPETAPPPERQESFARMLAAFGPNRPVVLAASTHAGEERWIGEAVSRLDPKPLFVVVPRHAERRAEVKADLETAGWEVVLRSDFSPPIQPERACLVVDSTGELRDWTAHADVAVIGKSFLGHGGQNPAEAVVAGVPVICGPNMENFRALVELLESEGGLSRARDAEGLAAALTSLLESGGRDQASRALRALGRHAGATMRTIELLESEK